MLLCQLVREMMRRHIILGLLFVTACNRPSPMPPPPAPPVPGHTVRSWPSDNSGAPMPGRSWRLELDHRVEEGPQWKVVVNFRSDKATAALVEGGGIRGVEDLTRSETAEVRTLTERSRLDEGGHIGVVANWRLFETLTFQNFDDGNWRMVVLVTVGNKSFVDDPARRSLMQRLQTLRQRLLH